MTSEPLNALCYLDEKPCITISHDFESQATVNIYDELRNQLLFSGSLWPDFKSKLIIDLVPEIKDLYTPVLPGRAAALQQNFVLLKYKDEEDSQYLRSTINLFSQDAFSRMSDADELTVPEDYLLPISYISTDMINQAYISTRNGMLPISELLPVDNVNSERGIYSLIRPISEFKLFAGDVFRIVIARDGDFTYSPYYNVTGWQMEQYLFYNRLGGWDNIAMSGRRTVAPTYEFANGRKSGVRSRSSAQMDRKYKQNSGGMSLRSALALAQLLESPAIFHLVNGQWKRIVIDAADVAVQTDDYLHSLSFTYLYATDSNTIEL